MSKYLAYLLIRRRVRKITREPDFLSIMAGARINCGANHGESSYYGAWKWPRATWFQNRKREIGTL
jgi:hypothetical protein